MHNSCQCLSCNAHWLSYHAHCLPKQNMSISACPIILTAFLSSHDNVCLSQATLPVSHSSLSVLSCITAYHFMRHCLIFNAILPFLSCITANPSMHHCLIFNAILPILSCITAYPLMHHCLIFNAILPVLSCITEYPLMHQ